MPHLVGTVKRVNSLARATYDKLQAALKPLDADDVGGNGFAPMAIPELARVVLRNARGDANALALEMLALREKHRAFRRYLTDYDEAWRAATTNRERLRLQADFDNAWEALLARERRAKDRFVYKLWEVAKALASIPVAIGDKLATAGRRWAVTGQVRGLHAFWNDLLDAPTAAENAALASSLNLGIALDPVWSAHTQLAAAMTAFVGRSGS